jgi:hypothetical protein
MNHQLATVELEKKTIEELGAMLADHTLLPLNGPSNTDKILEILAIIDRKENKPPEQREAERIACWTGLLDRYGDRLPFRLEDVTRPREYKTSSDDPTPQASRTRFWQLSATQNRQTIRGSCGTGHGAAAREYACRVCVSSQHLERGGDIHR